MTKNPYQILGVGKDATHEDIVKAYKSLALKYHPDKNLDSPKEAAEKFKEISYAFDLIGEERKRRDYDSYSSNSPTFSFRSRNSVDDVFDNIFSQFFGDQRSNSSSRIRVKVSLSDAFHGCVKSVSVENNVSCESCKGTGCTVWSGCSKCDKKGFVVSYNGPMKMQVSCSFCQGRGSVPSNRCSDCLGRGYKTSSARQVEVKIPPGIDDGNQIRISGEGGSDIFVAVSVDKDERYSRKDIFIFGRLEVSYAKLVLGGDETFDLFGSVIKVKINPRMNAGSKIRIRGQGMPLLQNPSMRGDLILEVCLKMPSELSKEHAKAIEKLLKIENYNKGKEGEK